ncbi:MAG: SUMF1/EgtB/PvdO family nonheme iron enzyme [Chloroflexi bacterium]|nr:SUMF1/EgtB/PvdO family nonheme iron enzyme [Chloroflexota bacterium]
MPPKFFITHSWKDIDFARKLCDDLRANGLDGFFDAYSIKPGDLISKEISDGLEKCDVYVPILSHAALKSPWCDEEIHAALTLGKFPGRSGRPRIIPILVEDCQEAMPILLRTRLYIMFDGCYDDAFRELLIKGFGVALQTPTPKSQPPEVLALPSPKVVSLLRRIMSPAHSIIHPKAKKEMILVPAGEFVMGDDKGGKDEKPSHKVFLNAFYISRYPVTNAEYKKFVDATKHRIPRHWQNEEIPTGNENDPVVYVSWEDAVGYCKWAGVRLPTEAEWEKAASWDDAKKLKRVYPWGDEFDADKCNTSESKIGDTTPVGKYSPQGDSEYGVGDMAGNVWEWCADWYDGNYYKNSPAQNPQGPDSRSQRVLRGGSWNLSRDFARCAIRDHVNPHNRSYVIGFRVAESFPGVGSVS